MLLQPFYDHQYFQYGYHFEEQQICKSPVKTVLKKLIPTKSYGQNKILSPKMAISLVFLVHFGLKSEISEAPFPIGAQS